MIYYWYFISFWGLSLFKKCRMSRRLVVFSFAALSLFLCFSYMCGSDWRSYELIYNFVDFNNLDSILSFFAVERGFLFFLYVFKFFGIGFWEFFVFTKLICLFFIFRSITMIARENYLLVISLLLPYCLYYLFIDCPLRNLMSISIFMATFQLIATKRFWLFMLCAICATFIHRTAAITVLLYFLLNKDVKNKQWIVVFVLMNILLSSREIITYILQFMGKFFPYLAAKVESYLLMEKVFADGKVFSLGLLINYAVFMFLILKKEELKKLQIPYFNIVFNGAMLFLISYRAAVTIQVFSRVVFYFSVFYFCLLVYLLLLVRNQIIRFGLLMTVLCWACFMNLRVFKDFRYLPYTNVLFSPQYSFEERFFYNYDQSPFPGTDEPPSKHWDFYRNNM